MPHEFEQTQLTLFPHPEASTYLGAEGIIEHNEEHAAIQITYGDVFFGGRERGQMERTLPGRKNALDVPAQRLHFQDGFRLPDRGRDVRNKEVPCQECSVSF